VSLLLGNGDGSFQLPTLFGVGSLAYAAAVGDFNGDGAWDLAVVNAASSSVSVLLNLQGTTMSVRTSGTPSAFGQPVTFITAVSASVANSTAPTGTVTLKNGSTTIGSAPVTAGTSTFTSSTLPLGSDSLSLIYSGDTNYQPHTITFVQTVGIAGTTTQISSSLNPAGPNQSITLTATVASNTTGEPTGSVTFTDNGTVTLGSVPVNGSGVATLVTSTLAVGMHNISAAYGGDGNFTGSASSGLPEVVQSADFGLSASTLLPASVAPGSSATSTVTITPVGGFDPSTVALTCSVSPTASPAATCSLGAIAVSNGTGTATLTVVTAGPQAALLLPAAERGSGTLYAFALMIPAMLLGAGGLNKPGRRKLLGFCLIFLVLGGCLLQAACGGGTKSATVPGGNSGTPANAYTVTITGSANGAQQTASVSLTVQ
jgi:hypothetical protein